MAMVVMANYVRVAVPFLVLLAASHSRVPERDVDYVGLQIPILAAKRPAPDAPVFLCAAPALRGRGRTGHRNLKQSS